MHDYEYFVGVYVGRGDNGVYVGRGDNGVYVFLIFVNPSKMLVITYYCNCIRHIVCLLLLFLFGTYKLYYFCTLALWINLKDN